MQQQQQQASEEDPFLQENTRPCPQRHPEEASGPCRRCRRPLVFFLVVFFSAQTPSPLLFLLLFFFFIYSFCLFLFLFFSTVIPEKNKTTFYFLFILNYNSFYSFLPTHGTSVFSFRFVMERKTLAIMHNKV